MDQQPVFAHGAPIHGSQHLLVQPPSQFVGRDSDLNAIHVSLKAGTAVLLHGPAGIGKTALAAMAASGYAELPGGVLWLELFDDSLESLLVRVARSYGIDTTDHEERIEAVVELLQEQRPLIVLDGQLRLDAAREFTRECAPGVPLLLTYSHMAAGPWTPHAVDLLSPNDATALFHYLTTNRFDDDSGEVPRLVDTLGGYPLSIQIAACQMATGEGSPGEFLARIPDLPPGETNRVIGALMAAYRLLPKELQGMVLLLGTTFAGGASTELLADVSGAAEDAIRGRMRQLARRAFATEREVYDQPYFVTHELITTFAQTFLRGKKQLDAMQNRHLKGITTYVARHGGDPTPAHYRRLAAEMATVMSAGVFAARNERTDVVEQLVQQLAPTTEESFVTACGFEPELDWLSCLLESPEMTEAGLLGLLEPMEEEAVEEPVEELAAELIEDAAEEILEEPVEEAAALPGEMEPTAYPVEEIDEEAESPLLVFDEPETVIPAPPETPETFAEPAMIKPAEALAGPDVRLPTDAETLQKIGDEAIDQGDTDAAIERYTQALENYQADGNVEDELAALEALAMLSLESEQYGDVLSYVEQGTTLAQESDNPQREGEMLIILGDLQMTLGRLEGAEVAYQEAINALRPTEAWMNIGLTLDKLAAVYQEQQRHQDAIDVWQQALAIFQRMERPDLLRPTYDHLGDAQAAMQHWNQARASYRQALYMAQTADDTQAEFQELRKLGWVLESSGNRDSAVDHYRRALHLAFQLGAPVPLGRTLLALARLLVDDTTNLNRVVQLLEAAQQRLPSNTEVKRLLGRAKTRQERLARADVVLPPIEDSVEAYAQAAVDDEL